MCLGAAFLEIRERQVEARITNPETFLLPPYRFFRLQVAGAGGEVSP